VRKDLTMKKATYKIVFLYLLICSAAIAQTQLVHFPINSAIVGQDIQMEARLEGARVREIYVRIYYKLPEENSYRFVDMQPDINKWIGAIPGIDVEGERIEYFINAFLTNQTVLTFPQYNPYNQPEEVQLFPAKKPQRMLPSEDSGESLQQSLDSAIDSPLLLLSPEPNENIKENDLLFAVSLSGGGIQTDPKSIQIFLDGTNITRLCKISNYMATFEPKKVPPGQHWFKIVAKNINGTPIEPLVVNFTVAGEMQTNIRSDFRGHAFTDLRDESISDQDYSFNMAGGDFNGRYGVLQYSGKFLFSSLEDPAYQPRNRYSFSLKTKVLGVEGGDTYPRMNDLILWGRRVRGVSGYIHLGLINVDAVVGETYRGIEGNGTGIGISKMVSSYGKFAQKLIAVRPSIGSGRNFQIGISLVKIQDDTSSIKYGALPKDNIIVGPDFKLAFDRGRFTLSATSAISLLTDNTFGGALTMEEISDITGEPVDLPVEPKEFEEYFILNDSTIPLDPRKQTSVAYNVKLTMRYFRNVMQVGYKSIGAQYTSLANPWIRKDIEGFYFNDRLRLFKNRLYLNFGFENYIDNFSDYSANPALDLKTFNYGFSLYPGNMLPNINISLKNYVRNNDISQLELPPLAYAAVIDTLDNREKSLHRDLAIQLNYDIYVLNLNHSLMVNYISSEFLDDFNSSRNYSQEFSTDMRMFTLATRYQIPLKTSISYATNSNLSAGGSSEFNYDMYSVAAEYSLFRDKIKTFSEYRVTSSKSTAFGGTGPQIDRSHFRLGSMVNIGRRHTLTLDANIISYTTTSLANQSSNYSDRVLRLRWEKFL
jgi:hypothetical protein